MRKIFLFALVALVAGCAAPPPPPPPKPLPPPVVKPVAPTLPAEVRAVWVSDTTKLDWNIATRDLRAAGFNTMYVNFASGGAAFYAPGGNDRIARGIELAHQRGLAVHAKLIALFMFKSPAEFQKKMIADNRVMRRPDGRPLTQNGYAWLCPSHPDNRAMLVNLVRDMVRRYPVDGVQFDYIRYCEEPCCYCGRCPSDNAKREQVIDSLLNDLATAARQTRPGVAISAAVFSDLNRAREEKAQDWQRWLQRGYVDQVCTMTYTTATKDFEALVRQQRTWAGTSRRLVVGIGSWKMKRLGEVNAQIAITRRLGAGGFALFSYDDAAARDFLPGLSP
jgi:uncharacterized lipoprotein YddW (UPF0748 family)